MAKKNANGDAVSKMEAVRTALAEGHDMPSTGLPFIKERFGLEMSKSHFSNYKTTLRGTKGKRRGRKPGRKPKAHQPVVERAAAIPVEAPRLRGGIDIDAIRQVKALVHRLGAETVKRLAELMA